MSVYKSKSAQKCVETNDMETAVFKWENTSKRYKKHWFEAIVEIFESCKNWAKVYVLDKVNETITECAQQIKRVFKQEKPSWCYWIRIKQHGQLIFNKIGTTQEKNPYTRLKSIVREGWSNVPADGLEFEVKRIWDMGDIPPEGLESELRAKLIKKYRGKNYIKNDRFAITREEDEPTYEEMDGWASEYGATVFA